MDGLGFDIPPTALLMDTERAPKLAARGDRQGAFLRRRDHHHRTSDLGARQKASLISSFAAIRRLKAQGKVVIHVSHRLTEIFGIADSYTVFPDGALCRRTGPSATLSKVRTLIRMIVSPAADGGNHQARTARTALLVRRASGGQDHRGRPRRLRAR